MSTTIQDQNTLCKTKQGRRGFVTAIAGCAGLLAARSAEAAPKTHRVLTDADKIHIGDGGPAMIENAYKLGYSYEGKHGGCAQCTVAGLQDAVGFVPVDEGIFLAASCVDGGATNTGLANCGAFTGAGLVIGHLCGRSRENFSGGANLSHKLIRQVHAKFVEEYGSVLCREVRAASGKKCVEVVGRSAQWTAKILINQFAEQSSTGKAG